MLSLDMVAAKIIQTLWSLFLVFAVGPVAFSSGGWVGALIGVATIIYLVACFGCFSDRRSAWLVAIILPALVLARWLPMVVGNVYMYWSGHELYRDSPATILVVGVYAIVFVLPPFAIYASLLLDRSRFVSALRGRLATDDGETEPRLQRPPDLDPNPYTAPND